MEIDLVDGELVEVVKTTRKLEEGELQRLVDEAEAQLNTAQEALDEHNKQGEELTTAVATARAAVEGSKSTLERSTQLVGATPAAEVDNGTESAGGEVADAATPNTDLF